jgi:hypothetical protein
MLLEDEPPDRYRLSFKDEPGRFYMELHDSLFLQKYDSRPYAKTPYVAYWGPGLKDGLGDDIVYCGDWVLDQYSQNLPLEVHPENLHPVKAGDTIEYAGRKLYIEYIDWDNDGNPWNNVMIVRVDGNTVALSGIRQSASGGKPIVPEDFVRVACWPNEVKVPLERVVGPVSSDEFKQQLSQIAYASTEAARGDVIKQVLRDAGYTEINAAANGHANSEDFWVIKSGESELTAILATHYDKAGPESQGVHDNGCGMVVTAALARALRSAKTRLTYVFLFYGAHELDGHNWTLWLLHGGRNFGNPIKYASEIGGGGLIGAKQTFRLDYWKFTGWLDWRFPTLRINETGGPPQYLKHTATDNLALCDYSQLVQAEDQALQIVLGIEHNLPQQ